MKRILKLPLVAAILVIALLFSSAGIPLSAEENTTASANSSEGQISSKEEVIYCSLDNSGMIKNIYVVNILNVINSGFVYDYGQYSSLKNLTDSGEIVGENGKVKINASEGRFYYQGNVEKANLPWIIDVSYYMNQAKKDPKNLAGASGHVKIDINTRKNSSIDSGFFENYLLQVTAQLNTENFSNIKATGATLANAGVNKIITFTVLPGSEGNLSIEADVTDFELSGIEISAIPFSMQIEMPDMSELSTEFSALSDAISQLNTGISALEKGLAEISGGAYAITNGSSEFKNGLAALNTKSSEIIQASSMIMGTLNNLNAAMSVPEAQAANPQLAYGLSELAKSYNGFHMGLEGYTQGISQIAGTYLGIHSGIEGLAAGVNEINGGAKVLSMGANTLNENTKDLPQQISTISEELLSEYDKSDYKPVSFISSENRNITSVQFIMRTDKIEKEKVQPAQTTEPEPETFWTRFLDLFR